MKFHRYSKQQTATRNAWRTMLALGTLGCVGVGIRSVEAQSSNPLELAPPRPASNPVSVAPPRVVPPTTVERLQPPTRFEAQVLTPPTRGAVNTISPPARAVQSTPNTATPNAVAAPQSVPPAELSPTIAAVRTQLELLAPAGTLPIASQPVSTVGLNQTNAQSNRTSATPAAISLTPPNNARPQASLTPSFAPTIVPPPTSKQSDNVHSLSAPAASARFTPRQSAPLQVDRPQSIPAATAKETSVARTQITIESPPIPTTQLSTASLGPATPSVFSSLPASPAVPTGAVSTQASTNASVIDLNSEAAQPGRNTVYQPRVIEVAQSPTSRPIQPQQIPAPNSSALESRQFAPQPLYVAQQSSVTAVPPSASSSSLPPPAPSSPSTQPIQQQLSQAQPIQPQLSQAQSSQAQASPLSIDQLPASFFPTLAPPQPANSNALHRDSQPGNSIQNVAPQTAIPQAGLPQAGLPQAGMIQSARPPATIVEAPVVMSPSPAPPMQMADNFVPSTRPSISLEIAGAGPTTEEPMWPNSIFRMHLGRSLFAIFARQNGLALQMLQEPTGQFTFVDERPYTSSEALDLLNDYLLAEGFLLVRNNQKLTAISAGIQAQEGIVPFICPSTD